ncbi:MAG: NAD(P)H-dependent oxidoreductase [Cellulomonas sp.]|nr:NAD(P)H-dependent oxidoreductase [Cellulomonas sp.]
MTTRSLVVLSGGVSQPSSSRLLADRLAGATVSALAAHGQTAQVRTVDLRDLAHATVDATLTGFASGPLREVLDALASADGVVLVSPVYGASVAGLVKSFLDVLEPGTLDGVPVLLGATGGTARHSLALEYALRPTLAYLRAAVVPTAVFAATDDWATAGSEDLRPLPERIDRAGAELAAAVEARGHVDAVGLFDDVPSFSDLLGGA